MEPNSSDDSSANEAESDNEFENADISSKNSMGRKRGRRSISPIPIKRKPGRPEVRQLRSKLFIHERKPFCATENSGLMFVDGSLVLFHPNLHEIFFQVYEEWYVAALIVYCTDIKLVISI